MYGSIFRMKVKPGKTKEVIAVFEKWASERLPSVKGHVAGYVLQPDAKVNELVGVAVFSDEQAYRANAENPEQGDWYQTLRALLTDDPAWEDGKFAALG